MKWVYVALIDGKVSAFHKKKKIIEDYLRRYKVSNPMDECYIAKTRKDSVKGLQDYEDLYLTEALDNLFIQSKYVDAYNTFYVNDDIMQILLMRDDLMTVLSTKSYHSKKECQSIIESLKEVDLIVNEDDFYYVPNLQLLKESYVQLECYLDKTFECL